MDAFRQFRDAYPATRRTGGAQAKEAFALALLHVPLRTLLDAVAQHKRSEQWQMPRFIPSMTTWLQQERWEQVLPEVEIPESRLTPFERARKAGLK